VKGATSINRVAARFHSWLRGWLWVWVIILAVMVALAWMLGSWSTAWNVAQSFALVLTGACLAWLIVAGWLEWRQQRRKSDVPD
jgi:4-amino-4-deoxy-L-arabinose transferase-like glycosyltransferase